MANEGVDFEGESQSSGSGITVNLTDVKPGGGYTAMPRGLYDVSVEGLEFGHSQSSGNPMWTWRLSVENHADFNNRLLFYHTTFTEGGLPRVAAALQRIVVDDPDDQEYIRGLLEQEFDPEEVAESGRLLGARARARVDVRKFEGELRNNVRELQAPADATALEA